MIAITDSAKKYLDSVRGNDYVSLGVQGSVVDYVTELGGSYLSIKNPMSTSSCGCGESFGV